MVICEHQFLMKRQLVSFKTNIVSVSCSLYSGNEIIHEFGFGFVQAYAWYMNLDYLSLFVFLNVPTCCYGATKPICSKYVTCPTYRLFLLT